MRAICSAVVCSALLFGLCGSVSLAAPSGKQAAIELFEKSAEAYRVGHFDEAARLLSEAYRLYPQPNILYNLGRALEGKGDRQGALDAYTKYLRDEKMVPDRQGLLARIAALDSQLKHEEELRVRAAEQAQKAEQNRAAAVLAEQERQREAEQLEIQKRTENARIREHFYRQRVVASWTMFSVGAATLAVGGGLIGHAVSMRNDAGAHGSALAANNELGSAQHFELGGNVALGVGGAFAGIGFVWGIAELVHHRRTHPVERDLAQAVRESL